MAGAAIEALQIGVLLLIAIACVVALLLVWRDDHKWP